MPNVNLKYFLVNVRNLNTKFTLLLYMWIKNTLFHNTSLQYKNEHYHFIKN